MNPQRANLMTSVGRFLRAPMTVLVFGLAGVFCGAFAPRIIDATRTIGELYLTFLGLLAGPFLFSSLSASLASMLQTRSEKGVRLSLGKVLLVMYLSMVATGVVFLVVGKCFTKLFPSAVKAEELDAMLQKEDVCLDRVVIPYFHIEKKDAGGASDDGSKFSFRDFLRQSVPKNIFLSLVENNILHILILTIFIGIALGVMPAHRTQSTISMLNVIYHACMEFVVWSTYLMPFIVFSLLGRMVEILDVEILVISSGLLGIYMLCSLLSSAFAWWIWSRSIGYSLRRLLREEGRALLFAFCSGQRIAALPMFIQDMEENEHLPEKGLKILLPFSLTVGMQSLVGLYAFIAVFIAHLYGIALSLPAMAVLCLSLPLIVNCGTYPLHFALLAKIFNLPDELAMLLLVGISTLIDPFSSIWNSSTSCAFTAWCLRKNRVVPQS